MKTFKIFSTAARALMMAACSSEDTAQNNSPAQQGQKVPFSATIAAPGSGAGTRTEYTEVTTGDAAGTINVAWKTGDEIALIHDGKADVVKVEIVNADGSATIAGDITVGTDGEAVEVCYPAAAWEWNDEVKGAMKNADYIAKTVAQDGTLKYIQDNLDVRMGAGKLKVDGNKATLSANVKLDSQIAIWKLTLQDDAETPAALSAKQVSVILDGEVPVTIASTAKLSKAVSSVYLAMPEMSESEATVTIEAVTADGDYTYVNSGLTLDAGQYYQNTVTMAPPFKILDLATVTEDITIEDGYTVTGKLAGNYKVSIADGATVTLDGITINGTTGKSYNWAGITCVGDATIILKDGTTNTVKGFNSEYSGIFVPKDKTLTIKGETEGTGKLIANSNGHGAGIGGGDGISSTAKNCGNIVIQGGVITATGGSNSAGIGSGGYGSCGDITISGGTVTATGGEMSAAIGSGYGSASCGKITITDGVTSVTATKGSYSPNSIGAGDYGSTCGTVTIGGNVGVITVSPYIYPAPTIGDVTIDPFAGGGDPLAPKQ